MVGRTIAHYEITEKLGEGGMGVVYKARDTRLDRFVAIKVLPPEKTTDPDRKRRFVQEAKAASALNHPHIITIYDIAGDNSADFIVMEYVPGKTLDQLIPRKGLRLNEALKYAVQIAEALAAAHGAGIVHRDLKPGNIMVSEDGRVKVLDFGLAKLAEPAEGGEMAETRTIRSEEAPQTAEGKIVGTVAYMSPEQAQGKKVDARSDIFSFGTLLYEMVTGQRPFQGDTNVSMLAAVLKEEPMRAGDVVEGLPKEMERVIIRCLRKDPERRFQHMKDLKVELEELREESASGTLEAAPPVATKPPRRWAWGAGGAVVLAAGALWFGLFRRAEPPGLEPKLVPLTSYPGSEMWTSFSPDGNQVAFAWQRAGREDFDIYVKVVGSDKPLQLTNTPDSDSGPAWSPDGREIAFYRNRQEGGGGIYVVSPLGGPERLVAEWGGRSRFIGRTNPTNRGSQLSWSPDGKWLAYGGIWLLSPETGEKRRLTSSPTTWAVGRAPVFSPDGQTIAFVRARGVDNYVEDIYVVSATGGEPRRLTSVERVISGLCWTADGGEIVFSSSQTPWAEAGLWRVSVDGGKPRRLEVAGQYALFPSISPQGRRLAFTQVFSDTNIWRVETPGAGGVQKPAVHWIASTRTETAPQFSPDGKRIGFTSDRSGTMQVWVCDRDGSNASQLTSFSEPGAELSGWSPDGRSIAFNSLVRGNWDIYVFGAQGGAPRQLTVEDSNDSGPSWSRDGRWVYFGSNRTGRMEVWKVPAGGGPAVQVTKNGGYKPVESPDGKFVYYTKSQGVFDAWKVPVGGGVETPVLENLRSRWALGTHGLYFFEHEQAGEPAGKWFLKFYDFSTGRKKPLAALAGTPVAAQSPSVSPDGREFLYTQWDIGESDLMVVENFR